ncbi:hypothetical protein Gogos_022104 [Gossypium gossypioides]|uniref:Cytochrome P450 CYP749A22-like n=1 Tax=Gossypium gossypioides TaxID=34282 RepID=A0A7J9D713_GOSGO|nr:hypothetical protein [Gossypium gossypioides]
MQNLIGEVKKMETMGNLLILFPASLCLFLFVALLNVFYKYWWIPHRKRNHFLSGKTYLSWNGVRALLLITDPDMVNEVLKNSEKAFRKPKASYFFDKLLGDGLGSTESEKWARLRKLAYYAFHGESLKVNHRHSADEMYERFMLLLFSCLLVTWNIYKLDTFLQNMIPAVVASVETMLEKWKSKEGKEIEVFQEFRLLTSEVISRTAFGSSYLEGEKIFDMLMKLTVIAGRNIYKAEIPIIRLLKKREAKVVTGEADNFGRDFLGLLVNAYHEADEKNRLSIQDLVDECKTFYFAGQETVNSLLTWATLLLAIHTDWQDKARAEVIEVFDNQNPDSEGMAKLKTISMVINETLRLYPPISGVIREVRLGTLVLPTHSEVDMRIIALHHDPDLWGDDVDLFKPERFADVIAEATKYNAATFMPFGLGPRSCVGMSFTIIQAKIALSMILQRYTINLSPSYVHAALQRLTLKLQHGIQLLFHSLCYDA